MALSKKLRIFQIKQLKAYPLISDDETAITYGPGVEVAECKKLTFKPTYESYACKHNGKTKDEVIDLIEGEFGIEGNFLDLDIMKILEGDTLATAGTADTETHTLDLKGSSTPPYFKIEAKVKYTGKNSTVKDAHVILYKCIANGPETNLDEGAFASFPFSGKVLLPEFGGDDAILRTFKVFATDTDLSA